MDVENCQLTTSTKRYTTYLVVLSACLSWWVAVMLDFCSRFAFRASLKVLASHACTWSSFIVLFAFQHLASHFIHQRWGLDEQGQRRGRQTATWLKSKSLIYTKHMKKIFCFLSVEVQSSVMFLIPQCLWFFSISFLMVMLGSYSPLYWGKAYILRV